jgi:hypothetical protein
MNNRVIVSEAVARGMVTCVGCGKEKDPGLLVCWGCFKHREGNLNDSGLSFEAWQAGLPGLPHLVALGHLTHHRPEQPGGAAANAKVDAEIGRTEAESDYELCDQCGGEGEARGALLSRVRSGVAWRVIAPRASRFAQGVALP